MNWKIVDRSKRAQPGRGGYSEWKEQVANDCSRQCVYCAIGEMPWGGIDNYHIDHFKPKSKFIDLINIITNLYYSCPICNRFKSDDWPADSDCLEIICYPDPSDYDYNNLFNTDVASFLLIGKNMAARYIVERLYLNRPQLLYERREHFLNDRYYKLEEENTQLSELVGDIELLKELIQVNSKLSQHMKKRSQLRPYHLKEIRKTN